MARSRVELMGLEYEAERLVRSGVSRADVSRMLGVHVQTLAQWALAGKWRRKDLDVELSRSETQRTIRNIASAHARRAIERETLEAQSLAVREAIRLIVERGPGAVEELQKLIEGVRALPRLEAPLPPLVDPVLSAGRSLGESPGGRDGAHEPDAQDAHEPDAQEAHGEDALDGDVDDWC